jgi:hypothetical protein
LDCIIRRWQNVDAELTTRRNRNPFLLNF